jgi:hypothetical protein
VTQTEQNGTGHALACCRETLEPAGGLLIVAYGDCPLLRAETLAQLVASHRRQQAACTVITTVLDDPTGYGRILKNAAGNYVEPTLETATAAAAGIDLPADTDFRVSITNAEGPNAYPITSFTWLLLRKESQDTAKRGDLGFVLDERRGAQRLAADPLRTAADAGHRAGAAEDSGLGLQRLRQVELHVDIGGDVPDAGRDRPMREPDLLVQADGGSQPRVGRQHEPPYGTGPGVLDAGPDQPASDSRPRTVGTTASLASSISSDPRRDEGTGADDRPAVPRHQDLPAQGRICPPGRRAASRREARGGCVLQQPGAVELRRRRPWSSGGSRRSTRRIGGHAP